MRLECGSAAMRSAYHFFFFLFSGPHFRAAPSERSDNRTHHRRYTKEAQRHHTQGNNQVVFSNDRYTCPYIHACSLPLDRICQIVLFFLLNASIVHLVLPYCPNNLEVVHSVNFLLLSLYFLLNIYSIFASVHSGTVSSPGASYQAP